MLNSKKKKNQKMQDQKDLKNFQKELEEAIGKVDEEWSVNQKAEIEKLKEEKFEYVKILQSNKLTDEYEETKNKINKILQKISSLYQERWDAQDEIRNKMCNHPRWEYYSSYDRGYDKCIRCGIITNINYGDDGCGK